MPRVRSALLVIPLVVVLTACSAPDPSASPSTSRSSSSATAKPSPSASSSASPGASESAEPEDDGTAPGPDDTPAPLPSTAPESLDWFGLDQGTVRQQCHDAMNGYFAGAKYDDLPSRSWREEETVVSFEWIIRGWEGAPDFPATCTLGLEGGAITSVFITVQDI